MTGEADKCAFCDNIGYGKGGDEYDHIHCRMCPTGWDSNWNQAIARSTPAQGSSWNVFCKKSQKVLLVNNLPNRQKPREQSVPAVIFRSPCQMIQVTVGELSKSTFVIHEPLLTASSAYFQRALKRVFKEGQDCQVDLEEGASSFGFLSEFLYKGSVQVSAGLTTFGDLWLLAHYLQMPTLINYTMWRLLVWMDTADGTVGHRQADIEDIYDLYDKAPMESKLRKFLVDLIVWSGWDLKLSADAPAQMLLDLVAELRRKCDADTRNPLFDVVNYYTKDGELVPLEKMATEENAAQEEATKEEATEAS